ncbi:MAG TPA: RodZ domain-containing protein [Gammaproteobacteria bacterium]
MSRDDQKNVDEAEPQREEASVGQTLKAAREALDLTLEQISTDLRIETQFLQALEDDAFESFSAPVFTKGYLRQYALRVNLDDKALLTQYYRQVGAQNVPSLRPNSLELLSSDQSQARWLVAGSAVLLVAAAAALWWFNSAVPDPAAEPETGAVSEPAPIASPEVVSEVPSELPALPAVVSEAEPEVEPEAVAEEPPDDPPVAAPEEADEPTLAVEIVFQEDCWTEVIDARGERLFYGLGSAGARTRFEAMPPLSFFLGNASGVEIFVNDETFTIPAQNRQGNLARFVVLDADN